MMCTSRDWLSVFKKKFSFYFFFVFTIYSCETRITTSQASIDWLPLLYGPNFGHCSHTNSPIKQLAVRVARAILNFLLIYKNTKKERKIAFKINIKRINAGSFWTAKIFKWQLSKVWKHLDLSEMGREQKQNKKFNWKVFLLFIIKI